jgi:hypothetical protein
VPPTRRIRVFAAGICPGFLSQSWSAHHKIIEVQNPILYEGTSVRRSELHGPSRSWRGAAGSGWGTVVGSSWQDRLRSTPTATSISRSCRTDHAASHCLQCNNCNPWDMLPPHHYHTHTHTRLGVTRHLVILQPFGAHTRASIGFLIKKLPGTAPGRPTPCRGHDTGTAARRHHTKQPSRTAALPCHLR